MILPSTRAIWAAALLVIPCMTATVAVPEFRLAGLLLMFSLVLLAAMDAVRWRVDLNDIGILMPEVSRMTQNRSEEIEIEFLQKGLRGRAVGVVLAWPEGFHVEEPEKRVRLSQDNERCRVYWTCTPGKRGKFRIREAYLETSSRWGLWHLRNRKSLEAEIRVYPNLMADREMAAYYLRSTRLGLHVQRHAGQGREFEKLREYVQGDSMEDVHWKATAKRGHLITKVYQVESNQEIYVLLDASRLSSRRVDDDPMTFLERGIGTSLVLGNVAETQNDSFGLVTFSDKVEGFVRAKGGKENYMACRDQLYALEARRVTPDFEEVCSFVRVRLKKRSFLVFLTSLDDVSLSENMLRGLDLLRRQHVVFVGYFCPPDLEPLFHREVDHEEEIYDHLAGHMAWVELKEMERILRKRGILCAPLNPKRMVSEVISQYLRVKRRNLL